MKNTIYIFLVFVLVFFLNLLLYIYVDPYREVIKSLKYGGEYNDPELGVDDSYKVDSIESPQKTQLEKELLLDLGIDDDEEIISEPAKESPRVLKNVVVETPSRVVEVNQKDTSIGRIATNSTTSDKVLDTFNRGDYKLEENENRDDLLDVAREFPDEYLQFSGQNTDLYILSTRTYDEVLDMFNVIAYDMPFTLNVQNNFGTRSFYINLDRSDEKVRFVFEYNGDVFAIKTKKIDYNKIKTIINNL